MNIKELKHLLNVSADAETNGEMLVFLGSDGKNLSLSYKRDGSSVTTLFPYKSKKFLVQVDLTSLQCVIADFKPTDSVEISELQGDLVINLTRGEEQIASLKVSPSAQSVLPITSKEFLSDYQPIELTAKDWKMIDAIANIMLVNQSEVAGLEIFVSGKDITVKGMTPEFICQRKFTLDKELELQRIILPIKMINLVGIFQPKSIKLNANTERVLIDLGHTLIMSEPVNIEFPVTDGLMARDPAQEISATIDRSDILKIVQNLSDAGAKKITLVFGNQNILIKGAKQTETLTANIKNAASATITIATNVLLAILGSVNNAKVIFLLPFAGASSLIVEVVSGLMFVVAVAAKELKKRATTVLEVVKDSEPEREVLQIGTNSDGSQFMIEAVEDVSSIKAKNLQAYHEQVGFIIDGIDAQIQEIEKQTSGEYLPASANQMIAQKGELLTLKDRLNELLQESAKTVDLNSNQPVGELEAIQLRFQFVCSRALELTLKLEKEWRLYIRFFKTTKTTV